MHEMWHECYTQNDIKKSEKKMPLTLYTKKQHNEHAKTSKSDKWHVGPIFVSCNDIIKKLYTLYTTALTS